LINCWRTWCQAELCIGFPPKSHDQHRIRKRKKRASQNVTISWPLLPSPSTKSYYNEDRSHAALGNANACALACINVDGWLVFQRNAADRKGPMGCKLAKKERPSCFAWGLFVGEQRGECAPWGKPCARVNVRFYVELGKTAFDELCNCMRLSRVFYDVGITNSADSIR
jgi:hypothetical protein